MLYKKSKFNSNHLKGVDSYESMSIEREIEQMQNNGVPFERGIVNMFYTQKKDGVLKETDIRSDNWDVAQNAMNHVNNEFHKRIEEHKKKQIEKDNPTDTKNQTDTKAE